MIRIQGIQHYSHGWEIEFSETGLLPEIRIMKYQPTTENMAALIFPTWLTKRMIPIGLKILGPLTLSPKFNKPTASPPRTTVKCNHERNVRSLAKETLGSTRTGRAIRFVAVLCNNGWVDIVVKAKGYRELGEFSDRRSPGV